MNVLVTFETDPWKITNLRVLTVLVCPAAKPPARPLGGNNNPEPLSDAV